MPIAGVGNELAKEGEIRSDGRVLSTSLAALKPHYRTGTDNLAVAFFSVCLREASLYRRAAGYFSSRALLTWAEALPRLVRGNDLKVRLITAPELSPKDISVFQEIANEERRGEYRRMLVQRMLDEVVALAKNPADEGVRARILAWLVANDRLEIRFAFATHVEAPGIFHEKMGVFDFAEGRRVAFTGSANETLGGHRLNYESIDVYRSWYTGDAERVGLKVAQFDEAWENKAEGLEVEMPTAETIAKLSAHAPRSHPGRSMPKAADNAERRRWRHQDEAVKAFLAKRSGVLEMATGTGKTRTTLKILQHLIEAGELKGAIVATDGTDLLDQWGTELDDWAIHSQRQWLVYRQYGQYREMGEFALGSDCGILVISRAQLPKVVRRIPRQAMRHMIIVHDEVHGLGVPSLVRSMQGQHREFGWCLGLSATPERSYDEEGNRFVSSEVGPTIYEFSLKAAIARGVLSEFDYVPLPYELTEGDRKRLRAVYGRRAARKREGNSMSDEEFWNELAKVYKTAEMKPTVFARYLNDHAAVLRDCIIFVETKEYGNRLLADLHQHTTRYRTYYAEDDRDHLEQFARREIDCLVTCHRLSQGIDLRSLRSVVLFASARSKLETIQRIGRCLRVDPDAPGKRALVVDFVRTSGTPVGSDQIQSADEERCDWLSGLSKVRRLEDA
ncbi:MAG: DEAD/DEAH box helicase family protein [Gammaproteobacteria bacterium]|nr:DEAD/DEAH box helicase family protein [Gammaproteobacteria bacterium]